MERINSPARVPPQDLGAERALIGALMLKPDSLNEIADRLQPGDFYSPKHQEIYKIILQLFDRREPIDLVTLTTALKEKKQLDKIGGRSYLAGLTAEVPSAGNANHYAELVVKKSARRRLIESADRISDLGYREDEEVDTIVDRAEQMVFGLSNLSRRNFTTLKDNLATAWERFERIHKNKEGLRGVPTGFAGLDSKLAGLQPSDLIILAARPSMGKTALALDIARRVAGTHKIPVGIFSLEMSAQQLVDRLIAAESFVDSWKLRTGRVTDDEEFAKIRDALDTLSKSPIFIDDEPSNNITKMKSVARRLKTEHGLGLIVVDYLQLMIPRRDSDSLVQQVTEISRSLKALARELDVPVLALSQLNRSVEQRGGRPRLSDLRDSGSIEQDADVVMFIHREDKYNEESDRKNIAEILIEKHRNGPTGKVDLYFDETRVCFQEITKDDFGGL